MKTVRLPIFEDGLELQEYLEIDLVHFLGAAGSEVAHNHMRVVQQRTPEQEKEMIDRIIAGLPPLPDFDEMENEILQGRLDHIALSRTGMGQIELADVSSKYPEEVWKTIPQFDMFEVSQIGRIRHRKTKRDLPIHIDGDGCFYLIRVNGVDTTLYPTALVKELF